MGHVHLFCQHDKGVTFNPWKWFGEGDGEGGWSRRKAFPQIPVSEGLLSFKRKYETAFKLLGPLS